MGKGGGGFIIFWPELPNIGEMSISRRRKPEGTDEVKIFPEGANGSLVAKGLISGPDDTFRSFSLRYI